MTDTIKSPDMAYVEMTEAYNTALCEAAVPYHEALLTQFTKIVTSDGPQGVPDYLWDAFQTSTLDVDTDHNPLNWSKALLFCGESRESVASKLALLRAGLTAHYKKIRDADKAHAKTLSDHFYLTSSADAEERDALKKEIKRVRSDSYYYDVTNPNIPSLEKIKPDQIEQWKVKSGWQSLILTGVPLVDWATKYEFLESRQKTLDEILATTKDPTTRADAEKALLLCIGLQTALGNPPAWSAPAKPAKTNASNVKTSDGEVNMGPSLVMGTSARKAPDMSKIETPDIQYGFEKGSNGAAKFGIVFNQVLATFVRADTVTTLIDNQKRFLLSPRKPHYKKFDPIGAYYKALDQTTALMTEPANQIPVPVRKDLETKDFKDCSSRDDEVDDYTEWSYGTYDSMHNDFATLCKTGLVATNARVKTPGEATVNADITPANFGGYLQLKSLAHYAYGKKAELGDEAKKVLAQ